MGRTSSFPRSGIAVMEAGQILPRDCPPEALIDRVLATVLAAEERFGSDPRAVRLLRDEFADAVADGLVMLGTPMLTNGSRGDGRPLGSCVAIPVKWNQPIEANLSLIEAHYMTNMGSGFNLDATLDPAAILVALNDHAEQVSAREVCERYIGNIANLAVEHPRIRQFVRAKVNRKDLTHFNISVTLTDQFFHNLVECISVTHNGRVGYRCERAMERNGNGCVVMW
jgi:ribonucleotide reductase alpha subunit